MIQQDQSCFFCVNCVPECLTIVELIVAVIGGLEDGHFISRKILYAIHTKMASLTGLNIQYLSKKNYVTLPVTDLETFFF